MSKLKRTYRVTHKLPNGTSLELANVATRREVEYVTETAKFQGTWLDDRRKLLRYGLGLIEVHEEEQPVKIVSEEIIRDSDQVKVKLKLENAHNIGWLIITEDSITAYNDGMNLRRWEANSFATLAFRINKEIAYDCMQIYEKYVETNVLSGNL